MKEKIKPLKDNVLIKIIKKNNQTKSGIVIPETANEERPQEGKVIAIGDSTEIKIKKNQIVIFAKYSGTEIKIEDEDYFIIKSEDLLAVVEE